ncbi:tetratricopeptide repeat protein 39B-like isoform X2 [Gigantopelta aegis]|uniref:tetratricopeptide repeat protein 39B-like isoform X2 n=1 Tax=Gigantopelta aegis TaxID=1735272 RepID=UPI001B887553|nr:tetratricopeptide repeat protein 39B-like isoform X2 [Gigantopelta aegis]
MEFVLCEPVQLDLESSLKDCQRALTLFFNNKFGEARECLKPYSESSMYHALGYGTILYIQAVMTFDMKDIEAAIQVMKKSVIVCNRFRKKSSLFSAVTKTNYNDFSEVELHAELCYAECLLIRALLTFIQDENLISFVKGGLKIRECYKIYKECDKMLKTRKWSCGDHRIHFESGVKMGVGAFNLMISLLPSKIMKLLEFVGFSGNKKFGLSELHKGSEVPTSLRGPLCSIILVAYHTVVTFVLGLADGDIEYASEQLQPCLKQFPQGALFLFFAGRIEEVRGNLESAIYKFEESIESQSEWRQFHHLCYWELMWCHCFKGDWLIAMKYAERLCRESRWSKATYTYQKATFLTMCEDQTEETKAHLNYLFSEVPRLKQRIAGKSIPFEKFAVAKSKRYLEQDGRMTLPALELIYVWNGFSIIGKRQELLEPLLVIIEKTLNKILVNKDSYQYFYDDYSLALLLKGVCLRHRGQAFQAEQCFQEVISYEKMLKFDTFLVPYSLVEIALLYLDAERVEDLKKILDKAKKHYKGYYLESRLHFRIHAIRLQLNILKNSDGDAEAGSSATQSPDLCQKSFDFIDSVDLTDGEEFVAAS